MLRSLFVILGLVLAVPLVGNSATARAQTAEETTEETAPVATYTQPPAYQDRLLRLAEIVGSVQYLRNLCNGEPETSWRDSMQALIDSETGGEPQRRESLTAGYNRGFRAFASVYASCTDAARVAEARYRREGATLVSEIVARYGN